VRNSLSDWIEVWNYTSSDWAGLQFVVLTIAAVFAWRQLREAASLRTEQARPYVVVEAEIERKYVLLVVRNLGRTVARDVTIAFDPPLKSSLQDQWQFYLPIEETKIFKSGIPTLPPGKSYKGLFDSMPSRESTDLPDIYSATVEYRSTVGDSVLRETMILDLGLTRNLIRLRESSDCEEHDSDVKRT
jgi:hypothetical protein